MGKRNFEFSVGNWYHCYNRSLDQRVAFTDARDYTRFLELLYLANDEFPLRRSDFSGQKFEDILDMPRGDKLVSVGAFCLMPDHFQLVLKEVSEGGITTFMRKLGTAYTMYFNSLHSRSGNLFLKPFQSLQVSTGRHLEQLVHYVHCSPAMLYEPKWMTGHIVDPQFLGDRIATYPYSSMSAHAGKPSPTSPILDAEAASLSRVVPIQTMLQGARKYLADASLPHGPHSVV